MAVNRFDELGITGNLNYFRKFEIPTKKQEIPVTATEDLSKRGDANLAANLQKQALAAKFAGGTCTPDPVTPEKPQNYSEIDKQADELIKKHTESGFWGDSFKPNDLGPELAQIAKTDPDRASALVDNILDKTDDGDKDEIAQSFVESMSAAELREYAKTEKGREMLGTLRNHLDEGATWDDEYATMAKIDTTIKAADFERSCEFKNLSPEAQKEVLSRLDTNQGNNAAVDNLIKLVKSNEFAGLPVGSQKNLLNAYDNHKEDGIFTDGLIVTAGKNSFQGLTEAQQAQVLNDLVKLANSESYKGTGGLWGYETDEAGKAYILNNVGNTAILSAQEPNNAAVKNTLDKILNNEIRIELYSEPSKNNRITFGTNNGNGVLKINMHPDANNPAYGVNNFTDTIVHELNHQLNQGAEHGTPEQFLNEYRAFYVGVDAVGPTPSASTQKRMIDNLITGYPKIAELYKNNSEFKKFIDDAKAGLDKNPPELLDPETMRQKLVDAGFKDDYLQTPGNLDNH